MQVIPAIDIRGGKCVRLRQGDYQQETVYSDDPLTMAKRWVDEGADYLHLVDLDGAKSGQPVNTAAIASITRETGVPCQLGGGLRTDEAVRQALDLGVQRVIIGTKAVREPDWFAHVSQSFAGQIVLGLDAKDGHVATEGWLDVSSVSALDLARRYESLPLAGIVYTDIAKDGMMSGPNFEATERLARASRRLVIASGGVTSIEDVLELRRRRIGACILGRTLYEGSMKLSELLDVLSKS